MMSDSKDQSPKVGLLLLHQDDVLRASGGIGHRRFGGKIVYTFYSFSSPEFRKNGISSREIAH